MSDLIEVYNKRKATFLVARKTHQESLDSLRKRRQVMIDVAVEAAKKEAAEEFSRIYGGQFLDAQQLLDEADNELALLRCPKDNLHSKPESNYYRCEVCGFVWDDTSPAHY